ncbi:hypothetical protein D3C72_2000180 [compost metagenome]
MPLNVPMTPIVVPVIEKMRMMAPRVAPIVRSTAMSELLSFTSMMRLEMMLNAATRMIMDRMVNITTRSTCSAEKKVSLRCCQSVRISGRSSGTACSRWRIAPILSGSSMKISAAEACPTVS